MIPTVDPSVVSNIPGVQILGIAALIYLSLKTVSVALPKLAKSALYKRLLPLCIPEALGVGAFLLLPGFSKSAAGLKIVYGISAGMFSSKAYKIISQTILGNDTHIRSAQVAKALPPAPPATPPTP